MKQGYVKLFRSLRDHWIHENPVHFKAWFDILSEVNFTEKRTKIGNRFEICGRGQSLFSLESWARIFGKGWNKTSVRRFFKLLETDEMIVFENLDFRTTRITVVNYDEYQAPIPAITKEKPAPSIPLQTPSVPLIQEVPKEIIPKETKAKAPKEKSATLVNEKFEAFYSFYGKNIDKPGTQKVYEKLTAEELSIIDTHLPAYIKSRPDKQYRKDPKKYLQDKVFNDEVISTSTTTPKVNQEQKNKITTDNANYSKGTFDPTRKSV